MENHEHPKTRVRGPMLAPITAFALVIETACEQFEMLQLLISGGIKLAEPPQDDIQRRILHTRANACIRMALAKSFVANVIRARRIIEHGQEHLKVGKLYRKVFLSKTQPVIRVRDVNEHGYDVVDNYNRPELHFRANSWGDETSLHIGKSEEIFMGPINLYSIYRSLEHMRTLAGFQANPRLTLVARKPEAEDMLPTLRRKLYLQLLRHYTPASKSSLG